MNRKLDFVLPVNPSLRDDDRRVRICLSSLDRYLDPTCVGRLLLVVPDAVEPTSVSTLTWDGRRPSFAIDVVRDRDLLGVNAWRERTGGWYTQQFIKLAAADHLSADFYVTLDADVVLTRPTGYDDLIEDGRARTLLHTRRVHVHWWTASAQVLDTDPRLDEDGMGVTPAVLSRHVACGLMRELEARLDGPWYRRVVEFLDDQKARGSYNPAAGTPSPTEYTLYYLFAEKHGLVPLYHVRSEALWCLGQVFTAEELRELPQRLASVRDGAGRFFVLQSALGIAPEWVWENVAGALGVA